MPQDSTPSADTGQRRDADRVALNEGELVVKLASVTEFLDLYASNLSSGGMFIAIDKLPEVGQALDFSFTFEEDERDFSGAAQVVWHRTAADEDGPRGVGVRFTSLDRQGRELIREIIAARAGSDDT